MKPIYRIGAVTLLVTALGLRGCTMNTSSNSAYISGQAQHEQTIRFGTVDSIRSVAVNRGQMSVGTVAGGVIGGIGSAAAIDRGSSSITAGVLGVVLGDVTGSALEGQMNKRLGLEITVKLDNGEYHAITQDADEMFHPGECVRLLSSGGMMRATHWSTILGQYAEGFTGNTASALRRCDFFCSRKMQARCAGKKKPTGT